MKSKLVMSLIVSSFLTSTAMAATQLNEGVYVEGNLGYSKVNEEVIGAVKNDNTGISFNVSGGYKFTPYLAGEIGYNGYPNEKFTLPQQSPLYSPEAKGSQNYAMYLALKGILPLADSGFSLFGKAGAAWVHHKLYADPTYNLTNVGTHSTTTGFLGAGIGFAINEHISVIGQGSLTTKSGKIPAMYQATAGLQYLF